MFANCVYRTRPVSRRCPAGKDEVLEEEDWEGKRDKEEKARPTCEKCVRAYASSVVSALEERLKWATAAAVAAKLDGR